MHLKWKTSPIQGVKHCGKKEIACYKQFLLFFHNDFHSYIFLVTQNEALCGNGLKTSSKLEMTMRHAFGPKIENEWDDKTNVFTY